MRRQGRASFRALDAEGAQPAHSSTRVGTALRGPCACRTQLGRALSAAPCATRDSPRYSATGMVPDGHSCERRETERDKCVDSESLCDCVSVQSWSPGPRAPGAWCAPTVCRTVVPNRESECRDARAAARARRAYCTRRAGCIR
eukprot:4112569-Prymnesium_polylepis.1